MIATSNANETTNENAVVVSVIQRSNLSIDIVSDIDGSSYRIINNFGRFIIIHSGTEIIKIFVRLKLVRELLLSVCRWRD